MMQFLITILTLVLIGIALFAIKFIQEGEKDQKRREQKNNEFVADLETKLKSAQEEFAKEKSDKQEVENILYKTKDELDNLKNQNIELAQRAKESAKREEAVKQEILDKEKLKTELEVARKQLEQFKKDKDSLQKELENIKKDIEPLKIGIEPLKQENEVLKNKLKFLQEIHEGLKGQYDELSKQLEDINQQRILDASNKAAKEDKKIEAKTYKSEEKSDTKQNIQKDKKETRANAQVEKDNPIEQKQEKPPSGSPENKSNV